MNITTDSSQEAWHRLDDPGSYEWWYFDAGDEASGISIVLIWFAGFPFSPHYMRHYQEWRSGSRADLPHPEHYAGFSFQLYEHGREVVNFIKEGPSPLFESSFPSPGARFEENLFSYDPLADRYLLTVDFAFPARRRKVRASFEFIPRIRYDYRRNNDCRPGREHNHQWLLLAPRADVEGSVSIDSTDGKGDRRIEFRGTGYHDHNLGSMPMHEYVSRWYWGRAFSERFDIIYYVIFFRSASCFPLAVLMLNDHADGSQTVIDDASFSESRFARGVFAPLHGRRIRMQGGAVRLDVVHQESLDAGPFYLRYASKMALEVDGRRIEGLHGISEFLDPAALQSRVMRFFTGSRIWREGSESAMYRYYNFFKYQFDWLNRKKS